MNVDCFCFIDCAVKIVNASWRRSVNDYVKKNFHAKEQPNRNHGDQKQPRKRKANYCGMQPTKMVPITRLIGQAFCNMTSLHC